MTPFPAPNRLHVWWARRPLVASRAAILASLLPANADRQKFLHVLGIHGDPVAAKKRIAAANRTGERLGADAYGYSRAFGYTPSNVERTWLTEHWLNGVTVLDPTAGGGSVPFEVARLGLEALANDLNPVAALIERATVHWPGTYGVAVKALVEEIGAEFTMRVRRLLAWAFPDESCEKTRPTVTCGRARLAARIATGWCRCRRTGGWLRMGPGCGSSRMSVVGRGRRAASVPSRLSLPRGTSRRARWREATGHARLRIAGG